MFNQEPKTQIDVGEIGNASTGDILFDGGNKINSNMDAIYNSFGDQRYYETNTAVGNQTIHGTGYYQKVTAYDFRTPLPMGSMWDIDTTNGAANPILSAGKPGEAVFFINSNGTCSTSRPIVIQASGGSFAGIQGGLTITQPYCRVECWCISNESNVPVWNYSISSMFGSKETPVETTKLTPITGETRIPLAHMSEYNSIKLLITAMTADSTIQRQSETNILIDKRLKNVIDTEFAVMKIGNANEDDEIVTIKYEIGTGDMVNLVATTKYANMRLSVKSIATQRVGSA